MQHSVQLLGLRALASPKIYSKSIGGRIFQLRNYFYLGPHSSQYPEQAESVALHCPLQSDPCRSAHHKNPIAVLVQTELCKHSGAHNYEARAGCHNNVAGHSRHCRVKDGFQRCQFRGPAEYPGTQRLPADLALPVDEVVAQKLADLRFEALDYLLLILLERLVSERVGFNMNYRIIAMCRSKVRHQTPFSSSTCTDSPDNDM